jgi:hypothetical protein
MCLLRSTTRNSRDERDPVPVLCLILGLSLEVVDHDQLDLLGWQPQLVPDLIQCCTFRYLDVLRFPDAQIGEVAPQGSKYSDLNLHGWVYFPFTQA